MSQLSMHIQLVSSLPFLTFYSIYSTDNSWELTAYECLLNGLWLLFRVFWNTMPTLCEEKIWCIAPMLLIFEEFCKPPLDLIRLSSLYAKYCLAALLCYSSALHIVVYTVSFLCYVHVDSATLLESWCSMLVVARL